MVECRICYEQVQDIVTCYHCSFSSCHSCWETFIVEGKKKVCMNNSCQKELNRQFIFKNFQKATIHDSWESLKRKEYLEKEEALLPMTQFRMKNKHSFEMRLSPFFKKCVQENCRGYLESNWQCGICSSWVCQQCLTIKKCKEDESHECSEDMKATVQSLQENTKPCPKCFTPIYKMEGCNQMWCTQCHIAFHWVSGEIITKFHNPHFVEFRRRNNMVLSRDPNDVECNRSLDDEKLQDSLYEKFSQKKRTRNTTNCCCRIEGTNKIVTGTKSYLELWEILEDGMLRKKKDYFVRDEWVCGMISLPESKEILISLQGMIEIWKFENEGLKRITQLQNEEMDGYLSALHYIPEKNLLLCGGRSTFVYYWSRKESGEFIFKGKKMQHSAHIYWISHIPNTDIVLSGGRDNKIVVWTLRVNILCHLKTIDTDHQTIRKIYKIPDCNRIVTTCHCYLKVWEFTNDFEEFEIKQNFPCYGMDFINITGTKCYISVGGEEHNLVFWNMDNEGNFEKLLTLANTTSSTNINIYTNFTCMFIPEFNKILVGNNNFSMYLWRFDLDLFYSIQSIIDVIRETLQLKNVDSVPYLYTPLDNEYLRISFLKNELTEKEFETRIFEEYTKEEENQEIRLILDLQVQGVTDIVYRICNNNDMDFEKYIFEIQTLTEYSNNLLKEQAQIFKSSVSQIQYNPIDESDNILTREII